MSPIRTPDDEVDKPGYFLPPFKEGWTYQGATYPGHSDFAVDWNRRTQTGGWLDDRGDPVLASAAGTVRETDPADGYVLIGHRGGYATEYRHMQPVSVKKGQKVERGDVIGKIGEAGNAPNGTHLHAVHYRNGKRIQMRFEGEPVATSAGDSDAPPAGWEPPAPVMVVGPPTRATWEGAFLEAAKALRKAQDSIDGLTTQRDAAVAEAKLATATVADFRRKLGVVVAERDALTAGKAALVLELEACGDAAIAQAQQFKVELEEAQTALAECEAATPDCSEAEQNAADLSAALAVAEGARDAAQRAADSADGIIEQVRALVAA